MSAWNEFTMALILITKESLKTLPLGLLFFQGQFTTNWGRDGSGDDDCQLADRTRLCAL
ncbi:hypothetical protein [Paenibacillus sedimenti]|uniref:hypothetical protein n=1 Tax=Paenibacillus sedimenti TaxID=2770274 RepID=UPI00165FF604|nr:hypothetical protein [Paenibacillus sedimenti]